ncbi:15182_t:CDS:1, partial [Acaulospora morrowiae]
YDSEKFDPNLSRLTIPFNIKYGISGDLSFAQFPNLVSIDFYGCYNLNSINISENEKLRWLNFSVSLYKYINCKLIVNGRQLDRVLVPVDWNNAAKMKDQCIIPYDLVEDRTLEQLEAEVKKLKQNLAEKNQQIKDLQTETKKKPTLHQFQELNKIVLPGSELNYVGLKEEIKRLKLKDFAPYFRQQKDLYDQLTINSKNKAGDNLKPILELFLQTRKQIIEQSKRNDGDFAKGQLQGQLTTCQTLLQSKFTQEELQSLLNMQEEILKLEEQSNSLRV